MSEEKTWASIQVTPNRITLGQTTVTKRIRSCGTPEFQLRVDSQGQPPFRNLLPGNTVQGMWDRLALCKTEAELQQQYKVFTNQKRGGTCGGR